ncbi:hypothetical protein EHYA_05524 [Embleya hyalina]|uniref:Uncharacterized protein n=1 Tax=Embleya hyalina TaxID=516124 RepID=A0A401YT80_9ACTN|nr:hypothetical protein EHYA_05524 [Embleya hyalina]
MSRGAVGMVGVEGDAGFGSVEQVIGVVESEPSRRPDRRGPEGVIGVGEGPRGDGVGNSHCKTDARPSAGIS